MDRLSPARGRQSTSAEQVQAVDILGGMLLEVEGLTVEGLVMPQHFIDPSRYEWREVTGGHCPISSEGARTA